MKQEVKTGMTDYTVLIFIPDPASTDGSGKTGLVAADLTVSGTRVETDNDVVVTDYTGSLSNLSALTDAHSDWGLKEVSSTLAPGLYRLDIADAIFASGAWAAVVYVMITTSAAAASPMEFVMIPQQPIDGVLLAPTTHTSAVIPTVTTATNVTTVNGLAANVITAAATAADFGTEIGTAVWASADRQLTALDEDVTTIDLNATAVGSVAGAVGSVTGNVEGNVTGSVGSVVGAVGSVTGNVGGNVTGSVGSVVGAVGSVTGNVGGNVTGSVGSIATGGIAAASFAAGAVDAAALAADAGTEIAAAVWAAGTRTITGGTVTAITGLTLANVENWSTRGLTMIEVDGGVYRYTTNALEQAPGGGGGGATAEALVEYDNSGAAVPDKCIWSVVRLFLNKKAGRISGSDKFIDVYMEDGTTVAFSIPVTSVSGADPIVATGTSAS